MTIEVKIESDKKDERAETVVEVCERVMRHLANGPIETSLAPLTTSDDIDPWSHNRVKKSIPFAEVTKCLQLISAKKLLQAREVMAFKTAMDLVADAFDDPTDLKVQIIKSMCEVVDCLV